MLSCSGLSNRQNQLIKSKVDVFTCHYDDSINLAMVVAVSLVHYALVADPEIKNSAIRSIEASPPRASVYDSLMHPTYRFIDASPLLNFLES
jgi:hypothetical protein